MQNVAGILGRTAWMVALLGLTGCSRQDPMHKAARKNAGNAAESPAMLVKVSSNQVPPVAHNESHPGSSSLNWEAAAARVQMRIDSTDRKLRRVRGLTRDEKTQLRRDVNAVQIERARQLGIQPGASLEQLTASGRLIKLADTTEYWIVRNLNYSVPYLTPSAEAMLAEIGRRFQARLDTLGVPRFRLDITSVLRTPDKQAALRRANSNASRIESAHEFGTTVDLAYRRFAPPAGDPLAEPTAALDPYAREISDSLMVETANHRSGELQAVLGRVLKEMQGEGKLMVRMERRQTVYHITVARSFPKRAGATE